MCIIETSCSQSFQLLLLIRRSTNVMNIVLSIASIIKLTFMEAHFANLIRQLKTLNRNLRFLISFFNRSIMSKKSQTFAFLHSYSFHTIRIFQNNIIRKVISLFFDFSVIFGEEFQFYRNFGTNNSMFFS